MEWQQDQDPEISVEDVFEITLDVDPESTFEGDLEYGEDSEGEEYPIFPPPSQELLQQQPLYIPDEAMKTEAYAQSPSKHQEMDVEEATEDGDGEEEDQTKGESWFNANGQMVMTKVPWPVMMQFIRNYLKSVASSQGPIWPVPNMNRSKRMSFAERSATISWKMECFFKYNKHTDRLNKEKTCKYIPSFLICSRNE